MCVICMHSCSVQPHLCCLCTQLITLIQKLYMQEQHKCTCDHCYDARNFTCLTSAFMHCLPSQYCCMHIPHKLLICIKFAICILQSEVANCHNHKSVFIMTHNTVKFGFNILFQCKIRADEFQTLNASFFSKLWKHYLCCISTKVFNW